MEDLTDIEAELAALVQKCDLSIVNSCESYSFGLEQKRVYYSGALNVDLDSRSFHVTLRHDTDWTLVLLDNMQALLHSTRLIKSVVIHIDDDDELAVSRSRVRLNGLQVSITVLEGLHEATRMKHPVEDVIKKYITTRLAKITDKLYILSDINPAILIYDTTNSRHLIYAILLSVHVWNFDIIDPTPLTEISRSFMYSDGFFGWIVPATAPYWLLCMQFDSPSHGNRYLCKISDFRHPEVVKKVISAFL